MMQGQIKAVEKIDAVWDRIRHEAEAITRAEPAMGSFIFSSILAHDTFETALIHRLAQRLGNADLGADTVVKAFQDALEAEPDIGHAARADIVATFDRDPACHRYIDPLLYYKGYQALQAHRMAHQLWTQGRKDVAYYIQSRSSMISTLDIHPAAQIGRGVMIDRRQCIADARRYAWWNRQRIRRPSPENPSWCVDWRRGQNPRQH
jgi:serine O-acetyltransferase